MKNTIKKLKKAVTNVEQRLQRVHDLRVTLDDSEETTLKEAMAMIQGVEDRAVARLKAVERAEIERVGTVGDFTNQLSFA